MRRLSYYAVIALGAVLLASLAPALRAKDLDKQLLYKHIRQSYNIPASVDLEIGDLKPSEVPGFDKAELKFARGEMNQSDVIYVSKDRRFYIMGADSFKDLSIDPDKAREDKITLAGRPVRGNSKASVTLVEFTDFQCPYCSMGYHILKDQMMKDFPTQVKWVYKSFPLKSIHPWAESAAVAAECVREQSTDSFWKMHDTLFENQRQITVRNADDKFAELAKDSGADPAKFKACYDAKATSSQVDKDEGEGDAIGLRSTPSFLVNGRLISGADYDQLKRVIEEELGEKKGG